MLAICRVDIKVNIVVEYGVGGVVVEQLLQIRLKFLLLERIDDGRVLRLGNFSAYLPDVDLFFDFLGVAPQAFTVCLPHLDIFPDGFGELVLEGSQFYYLHFLVLRTDQLVYGQL